MSTTNTVTDKEAKSHADLQVITNSNGSGDWCLVVRNGKVIYSGHSVSPRDLVSILSEVSATAVEFVENTDEEMEEF